MAKKTIIITGGSSGFGRRVAEQVAAKGYRVIIASNVKDDMKQARQEIIEATGNPDVVTMDLDLGSLASVRSFAEAVKAQGEAISGLLCNAGISSTVGRTPEDNMDLVFEINYLGHVLLTLSLLPAMEADGRVMMVSSDMHVPMVGTLEWLPATQTAYPEGDLATSGNRYSYSKLYLLCFTYELSRKLKAAGSKRVINAFNPGLMHTTGLMKNKAMFTDEFLAHVKAMNRLGDIDVNTGVMTDLMTADAYAGVSGQYFDRSTNPGKSSDLSYDEEKQAQLWQDTLQLVGLTEEDVVL